MTVSFSTAIQKKICPNGIILNENNHVLYILFEIKNISHSLKYNSHILVSEHHWEYFWNYVTYIQLFFFKIQ